MFGLARDFWQWYVDMLANMAKMAHMAGKNGIRLKWLVKMAYGV